MGGIIIKAKDPVACAVAVIVTHQGKVLFGKRRIEGNEFNWQLPGGWVETGETPLQAAQREVIEETGLQLNELQFVGVTNNIFSARNHSISLYFEAECMDADALSLMEGDACIAWEWRDWVEMTENLYLPLRLFKQTDYRPFSPDKHRTHIAI